jgi:hypothetical protein
MPYLSKDVKRNGSKTSYGAIPLLFFKLVLNISLLLECNRKHKILGKKRFSLLKQLCTCGLDVGGVVQFRALSDQLYRSPDHHKFVRSKVVFQVILYLVSFYIYCLNLFGPIRFTSQPMPDDRKCTLKI